MLRHERINMRIYFVSLGCDKNLVDSEVMLGLLSEAGFSFTDDENEADIPRRTFFRMKDDILILFGVEIECISGNKYAIANRDDIKSDDVQNWLLNSFSVSNLLMEGQSLKDRLLLEDIPSGNKYLTQVIDAMRRNLTLRVEYQSFKMSISRIFEIAPYCIKVFKQRWYIIVCEKAMMSCISIRWIVCSPWK